MRSIIRRAAIVLLASLFLVPAGVISARRGRKSRFALSKKRRYRIYHKRYRFKKGFYHRRGRRYYYHRGRYYPDRRIRRKGRFFHKGRYYSLRRGRYYRSGHFYYYYGGRYYRDYRRFRLIGGRYSFYYRGGWYVYRGGRYYYNGRYYYYYRNRYYLDDSIRYNYAEVFEDWDEATGKRRVHNKNPGVPGAIHYVNKRWNRNSENWYYYRSAYRPGKYAVSGPFTLKSAQRRVRRLNRATRDRSGW